MNEAELANSVENNAISAGNALDFYHDTGNIANQDMVRFTISYFETIRKDVFAPIDFLNLVWKQKEYVLKNSNNPFEVRDKLVTLLLNEEKKHILYFFIIYWFGGVYAQLDPRLAHTLRLIENEFKGYSLNTPEKVQYFKGKSDFDKLTFQQVKELKLKFDKLSYVEKLKFWKENYLEELGFSFTTNLIT